LQPAPWFVDRASACQCGCPAALAHSRHSWLSAQEGRGRPGRPNARRSCRRHLAARYHRAAPERRHAGRRDAPSAQLRSLSPHASSHLLGALSFADTYHGGGDGGGAGRKYSAFGCGSGLAQSSPTQPRWQWHVASVPTAVGCSHRPCSPHPPLDAPATPPTQRMSSHALPSQPASQRHSPFWHQPLLPQSAAQRRCWHHWPPHPAEHVHAPAVTLHVP